MSIEDILLMIIPIGLAVVAVRRAFQYRTSRARIAYITGLLCGAGIGVGVASEAGIGYSLGIAIGLGASVVGGYTIDLIAKRIEKE